MAIVLHFSRCTKVRCSASHVIGRGLPPAVNPGETPHAAQFSRLYGVRILGYFFWAAVAGAAGVGLGRIPPHQGGALQRFCLSAAPPTTLSPPPHSSRYLF